MTKRKHFPHDMGGQKDAPVLPDDKTTPVFAQDWHARALAITILSGAHGKWTLDESRHSRETLPIKDYKNFSYYQKWLAGLAELLVRHRLVTQHELKNKTPETQTQSLQDKTLTASLVRKMLDKGNPSARHTTTKPKFKIGDELTTLTPNQTAQIQNGHTRLPQYAAQKNGTIITYHGCHVLPDSNAHGLGENPEHLYAVRFKSSDLWQDANDHDYVVVDCWESYLK